MANANTPKKQHIHINRYPDPRAVGGWELTVTPEDGSFVLFVPTEGDALLYRRVATKTENGQTDNVYADVELPFSLPQQQIHPMDGPPPVPKVEDGRPWNPLDFTIAPIELEDGTMGFTAMLNCRAVAADGATEHEAIRNLMNYVAQLCTAGALDHTGEPRLVNPSSQRRYESVFGPAHAQTKHLEEAHVYPTDDGGDPLIPIG